VSEGRRNARQHPFEDSGSDHRSQAQRDRDRVIHTLAFRRLAFVTQVVGPLEGHVFHSRLTHSLEVAQIARRLAEKFAASGEAAALGGVDPDVVEAASLAHDLGHPPFGHIAEKRLCKLAEKHGCEDGFEGNAQTFRILTRLAAHRAGYRGLNLTRATLDAVLKYPWFREANPEGQRNKKYSVYDDDREAFEFAREGGSADAKMSVEAEIMEYADDLAYSVHDFDDFYRAGLIPIELLAPVRDKAGEIIDSAEFKRVVESWGKSGRVTDLQLDQAKEPARKLLLLIGPDSRYEGTFDQRVAMRTRTAGLISTYVNAASLVTTRGEDGHCLRIEPERDLALKFLRWLVWYYVINSPRLATQQAGQAKIIEVLFGAYLDAITNNKDLVPAMFRDEARIVDTEKEKVRLAVDIVASFTDSQAEAMFKRISGVESGSILDILER
jgi:dGTPase